MAEYVMAMVLGFAHRLPNAARMRESRRWPTHRERWRLLGPLRVSGSRLAIVGYGRIGRAGGARRILLTPETEKEIGPAWLDYEAVERTVADFYPLYREPGRHVAVLAAEERNTC